MCQHLIPFYSIVYHILFIHSSVDGHLGCFHFGAVMSNTAVNTVYEFLSGHLFSFLLGEREIPYLGMELLGHIVTVSNLLRTCQTVFQSNVPLKRKKKKI